MAVDWSAVARSCIYPVVLEDCRAIPEERPIPSAGFARRRSTVSAMD